MKKTCLAAILAASWAATIPHSIASPRAERKSTPGTATAKEDPMEMAAKLLRAARENCDDAGIAHAYKTIMYLSPPSEMGAYADSLVASAKRTGKDLEIGSAYLTKGALHYSRKELEKALDCFLVADPYLKKTGDSYLGYKLKYSLATTKHELGYYDDAISSFKECAKYFEEENDQAYLNSVHFLSLAYLRHGLYALSKSTAGLGLSAAKSLEIPEMEHYFRQVLGANMYFDKNYSDAAAALEKELPFFREKDDYANESASNFYIGSSLWEKGDRDGAIAYLKEVDRIFSTYNYIRPELMHSYNLLIDFYTERGDHKNISKYARRLDSADKVINREFKYLASTVYTKYDSARRKELIEDNENYVINFRIATLIILALLPLTAFYIFYIIPHIKKKYDEKFQSYIEKEKNSLDKKVKAPKKGYPSPEKVAEILSKIDKSIEDGSIFKKCYTKAQYIQAIGVSNEKALCQVIKHELGFGKYNMFQHTVRIEHLLASLKKDPSLYDNNWNDAFATFCGYPSGRAFSNGMAKVVGMNPSKFMPRYMEHLAKPESESRSIHDVIQDIKVL